MAVILALLNTLLFIGLIVGLFKPSIVLPWTKSPNRWKVVGYYFLFAAVIYFLMLIFGVGDFADNFFNDKSLEKVKWQINIAEYDSAIATLEKVEEDNKHYQKAQELLTSIDSIKTVRKEEKRIKRKEDNLERLERELKSIQEGIDFSHNEDDVQSLQADLILFGAWHKIIDDSRRVAKDYDENYQQKIRQLTSRLEEKVKSLQIQQFPKLRKQFGKVMDQELWENDIDVRSFGRGYRIIEFVGGTFAANRNIKEFQENIVGESLRLFRFDQSRYKWYEGDNEYTYYTLETPSDSEKVTFDK